MSSADKKLPTDRVVELHARHVQRTGRSLDAGESWISKERLDIIDARLERLSTIQQTNVEQIVRLTEAQMLANERLERLAEVAERQERHIDRLLGIVEHLIQDRGNGLGSANGDATQADNAQ
jgi:hypothetical protein